MWKKGKKSVISSLMEDAAKALRKCKVPDEGGIHFDIKMRELEESFETQNCNMPSGDLFPISRFKALKCFVAGIFKKSSKPDVIISFNGETFLLDFTSCLYEELTEKCKKEEDVLEQILIDESVGQGIQETGDPNWDGGGSEPKRNVEVIEKDFQIIPSPQISFCDIKVSGDTLCNPRNPLDPEKFTGRPDPRTFPVLTEEEASDFVPDSEKNQVKEQCDLGVVSADESNELKTSDVVEQNGKYFIKTEE